MRQLRRRKFLGATLALASGAGLGQPERRTARIAALVDSDVAARLEPGVIAAAGTSPTRAALVASLSRPAGNIAGIPIMSPAIVGKWIENVNPKTAGARGLVLPQTVLLRADRGIE